MKTSKVTLLLLLYGLILLLPVGTAPLLESTESRYGEIAREMLVTGNYLEPQFNGIMHFHKPPLAYWTMAAGMKLFGQNDFGVRFFGVIAAVVAVAFVYRMAKVILEHERQALDAAIIFATSLLMLAVARIASTDIYLTACTAAAQFYLFRQVYGERRQRNALLYGFWLGLGFLAKGPIILLFTLLPFLVAKLGDRQHRRVFTGGDIAIATLVFAAVSLPWYLLVIDRNPGLLSYFLKTQTVDRVVTNRFHRYQPFWYFFLVFAGTFLPYTLFLSQGLRRVREMGRPAYLLLIYVGVPLLVFSLAKGKLATYIMPFYGVASLFASVAYGRFSMPRLRVAVLVVLGILAIAPPLTPLVMVFKGQPLNVGWQLVLVAGMFLALGLVWKASRVRHDERFLAWVAASLLLFGLFGYVAFGSMSHRSRGYELLVQEMNAEDPLRQLPVMVYRDFLPSVSFYRGELAVMAMGDERETQFERDSSYQDHYLRDPGEVEVYLKRTPELFLVTKSKFLDEFTGLYRYSCQELHERSRSSAYRCLKQRPEPSASQP